MEHLPPAGWAEVATKHDLEQLEIRLEARLEAKIDSSARDLMHRMITTMIVLNTAIVGVAFAAGRLA